MRYRLAVAALTIALAGVAVGADRHAISSTSAVDIPPEPLGVALRQLAETTHFQIVFSTDLVATLRSRGAKGNLSAEEALREVLNGTGMTYRYLNANTVTIIPVAQEPQGITHKGNSAPSTPVDPSGVSAADAGPQPVDLASLQTVLVTAEHFRENEESTPIAMSVLSSNWVRSQGVTDLKSLSAAAPDTNFTMSEDNPIITMRGVSSLDTNELGDPAVSVDTDGFYVILPYALDATLYDLDHIEVLRGPQGTLNGRNSVGGAINIITASPTNHSEGYASLSYGNYDDLRTEAMLNVPITSWLQVRGAFASETHSGYRDNSPQLNGDDAANQSGRLKVRVAPTDDWTTILTLQYTNLGGQGQVAELIPYVYTASGALDTNAPPTLNPYRWPLAYPAVLRLTDRLVRFQSDYKVHGLMLTVLGGYDQMHHLYEEPQVATPNTNPPAPASIWKPDEYPDTYNGEIRLSQQTERLHWQVGFFAFGETMHLFASTLVPYDTSGAFINSFGFKYAVQARSRAGYGQLTWQLTRGLSVTGGVRYTHDYKSEDGFFGSFAYDGLLAPDPFVIPQSGDGSWHKATYLASIQDQLSANKMIYAKVANGYKAGGFNLGAAPYGPETMTSYEAGFKGRFLNDRVQLNADGYFANDTGQQVSSFVAGPGGVSLALTENAGTSHIYGMEIDSAGIYPKFGTVRASANYLHARYTEFMSAPDPSDPAAPPYNVNLAGNAMPQSPDLTFVGSFEHTWILGEDTLSAMWQTKYATRSYFSFYNFRDSEQHPYAISDFTVTFVPGQSALKISAYVRNLTNRVVLSDAEENQYDYAYAYNFQPPRTWGAQVEYRFRE